MHCSVQLPAAPKLDVLDHFKSVELSGLAASQQERPSLVEAARQNGDCLILRRRLPVGADQATSV
jgi:hypothetical protein